MVAEPGGEDRREGSAVMNARPAVAGPGHGAAPGGGRLAAGRFTSPCRGRRSLQARGVQLRRVDIVQVTNLPSWTAAAPRGCLRGRVMSWRPADPRMRP